MIAAGFFGLCVCYCALGWLCCCVGLCVFGGVLLMIADYDGGLWMFGYVALGVCCLLVGAFVVICVGFAGCLCIAIGLFYGF